MKKWQYLTHTVILGEVNEDQQEDQLDELGDKGWEAVGFTRDGARFDYLFKRRKRLNQRD